MSKPQLTLIQNSIDFLNNATSQVVTVQRQDSISPREIKYIVINLAIGLELLFKKLLWDNCNDSIFENTKVTKDNPTTKHKTRTISYRKAYEKVSTDLDYITLTEEDKLKLYNLGELRNTFVHHLIAYQSNTNKLVISCCVIALGIIKLNFSDKNTVVLEDIEEDVESFSRNMQFIVKQMGTGIG